MTIYLERIASVAARECERQQVGVDRLASLIDAHYQVMTIWPDPTDGNVNRSDICALGKLVEPSNFGELRRIPVTFRDGGSSASTHMIPELLDNLINSLHLAVDLDSTSDEHEVDHWYVRKWIKDFLWIHPFTDGNGRTAWVLYNWMRGRMHNPDPLPDFFQSK